MKININQLTFKCIIGILDFERVKKQKVIVDISFKYKFKKDGDFIDYSIISKDIEKIFKKEKFFLLEDSIIFLEEYLKNRFKIKKLKIKVSKPDILTNCIVSLEN